MCLFIGSPMPPASLERGHKEGFCFLKRELQKKNRDRGVGCTWILPWCCAEHSETPGSNSLNQLPVKQTEVTQTGTEVPADTRNPKQRQGQRALHSSQARPANLLYRGVGANFPWRLVCEEKPLQFLSLVLLPGISSGFCVSLTPKHGRTFPPPPTEQGNDSFYQLKATFPVCCEHCSGCPPSKTWNRSCFDWTPRSPGAVLYSDEAQSLRGKKHSWCKHSRLWMWNSSSVEIPWLLEMCSSHRPRCQETPFKEWQPKTKAKL